ncbi:unnamed protein product [Protopolystoma xenopodis]|uniref:Uncharacterized protein n=1 Tax=Protopolystoma xenopodis TaxID=117903 RepID=A0A3S5CFS5_9PLAT|nr:unnamed protein product [Protopolystoma xenopodis]
MYSAALLSNDYATRSEIAYDLTGPMRSTSASCSSTVQNISPTITTSWYGALGADTQSANTPSESPNSSRLVCPESNISRIDGPTQSIQSGFISGRINHRADVLPSFSSGIRSITSNLVMNTSSEISSSFEYPPQLQPHQLNSHSNVSENQGSFDGPTDYTDHQPASFYHEIIIDI